MEVKPGYKQTEVGVIPEEWEVKTLFELAERKKELFDDGDWIESEHITTQGIRLIQTGNIGVGRFTEKDTKKYIYEKSFTSLRCKQLRLGDLLVCRLADPAGRACVLPDIGEERIVTSVDVTIFRPPSEMADRVFLSNVFSTPEWFRAVSDRSGGTTHKRISRSALGRIPVLHPPLPEQRAIATALSDVDGLLGGLDRLIAKKRDLKQAAMQQLLTGQTRLPGFHGEWGVKRLGDVVRITKGQLITEGTAIPGAIPVIAGGKKPAYFHNKPNRAGKTVTISASGASAGYVAFFDEPIFASDCSTISESGDYSIEFVYFQLQLKQATIYKAQTGGAQPHIHAADINPIEFFWPTVPEQTAIAEVLGDMDAELAALEQRREKTRALKQAMMQELLTGRTRLV